jgi:hypothetical protein
VLHDRVLQLTPYRMAWQNAEVAAYIGDDGADRLTADSGGDPLRRGQMGESRWSLEDLGTARCRRFL